MMFDATGFLLIHNISDISGQVVEFSHHSWNFLFSSLDSGVGDVEREL